MSGPLSHISLSFAWWAREAASEARKGRIEMLWERVRIGGMVGGVAILLDEWIIGCLYGEFGLRCW